LRKKIVTYLQGGTGNQLFEFFAGLYAAKLLGAELYLDNSLLSKVDNRLMNKMGEVEVYLGETQVNFHVRRRLKSQLHIYSERILHKLANASTFSIFRFQYRSKQIGYDANLDKISRSTGIIGYFQTYRYIEIMEELYGRLRIELKSPTTWFSTLKSEIESKEISLGIHLRRGDYQEVVNRDSIGILTFSYFENVISSIVELHHITSIYFFSDDYEAASVLAARINRVNCIVVSPPKHSGAFETIKLMSFCDFRILSNSTLSWWGAYLSNCAQNNYVPSPWFRSLPEPLNLLPSDWSRCSPIWDEQ
jgi:hypothetical protein